jgi:4-hydroxybenzoate polyprenyltransferase
MSSLFSFFTSLIRLTRLGNLLIIGFAQYFVAYFLVDKATLTDSRLLLISVSTILIAAGGYIINDYYDIKIDYINKPERVVIGKGIPRRFAILFHTLFSLSGVAIGFVLSWQMGVLNFVSAFWLWLYSNSLKRKPFVGNFSVAVLTGLSIYCVEVVYQSEEVLILVYAVFAFFMTLIREIIKDMEDLKGDDTFGCKTLPIIWGIRRTKQFVYGIVILFLLAILTIHFYSVSLPLNFFFFLFFVPISFLIVRLVRADTVKDFLWLSTFSKVIMLLGILSLIFIHTS